MKITEIAAQIILEVMLKKGLNPKSVFLEVGIFNGNLGLGFTREKNGKILHFDLLTVIISGKVDATGVVIDFGEINGRKGLTFIGEEQCQLN